MAANDVAASFALGVPAFSAVLGKRIVGPLAVALAARIAAVKSRLIAGGVLQPVAWLRKTGPISVRGRQGVKTTLIDAFIEQRPALDYDRLSTDRADDTVLTILDELAIKDSDTFRWGDHTYSVSKVTGLLKDEDTGVRFSSEVTVIR